MSEKKIVFLSSSYVNLAKIFAMNNPECDVFLILDRKFPFEIEDLDNFYSYTFNKQKIYEKDKEKYFDNLAVMINDFEPDFIITNNFMKLLPKSFLDFIKFRNKKTKIINIHHGDLESLDINGDMKYKGMHGYIKEFLDNEEIITTIHEIENEKMDEGKRLVFSNPTTLKELKQKHLIKVKEDIINLRMKNVILSYHERTKVLKLIKKIING